jgi:adenylate kinase
MFMGVNGVGKSTLASDVATAFPDALRLNGSAELRRLFGGVSREELERLDPAQKLGRRAAHFLELFRRATADHKLVLMDTHLLVPIRSDDSVRYENTWHDGYSAFVAGAFMLTADPRDISAWRALDQERTGRTRDLAAENIAIDQELNVAEFRTLIDREALPPNSQIIENGDGLLPYIGARVLSYLEAA